MGAGRLRHSLVALVAFVFVASAAQADKAAPPKPAAAKVAPPAPKPVKQQTRAELEAEVERLRADNQKLRAELDQVKSREAERQKRLQDTIGSPATTLK